MFALFIVLAAAPVTSPWSARVGNELLLESPPQVTVYAAPDQPFDTAPCLFKKELHLIDAECTDDASTRALIAAAKKAGPMKVLATATADATGHFTVQVPAGRLFVHVASKQYAHDFVVEPVPGVETLLEGRNEYTRRDLTRELAQRIDERADTPDLKELWVIGQDNPQLFKLGAKDVKALLAGTFKGPLLWGCSKVVSARGSNLGTTCEDEQRGGRRGFGGLGTTLTINGRVTGPDGAPRSGVEVRVLAQPPVTVRSEQDGRFSVEVESSEATVLVVAQDGALNATALARVKHLFEKPTPAQTVSLRLTQQDLFRVQVKTSTGAPAVDALVRLHHDGNLLLDTRTDARGEFLAPRALKLSNVSVNLAHHRVFSRRVDLEKESVLTLQAARAFDVSFRRADGLLLYQPDVGCHTCRELSHRPARDGRVHLEAQGDTAMVAPGGGLPEVVISRDGVYELPRLANAREVPFTVVAPDDEPSVSWSTPSDKPEPGVQLVRACFGRHCVVQTVEVKPGGEVTLRPPAPTTLEVSTRGHAAGALMPEWVRVRGPHLVDSTTASFDEDGIARFERLPLGPWLVTVDDGFMMNAVLSRWCNAGQRCELDLSTMKRERRLQLRGAVPERVKTRTQGSYGEDPETPVVDGGIPLPDRGVVIEGTSIVPSGTADATLTLAAPTTIQVHVVDPQEQPVRDAVVSWGQIEEGRWTSQNGALTDADGRASFENLRPGNLPLHVWKPGFARTTTRELAAKNEVKLSPGFDVTCTVPGLKPSLFARCSALVSDTRTEEETTDDGPMTLLDLPGVPLTFGLVLYDTETGEAWSLTKQVDPAREREVSFEAPRTGVRLVIPLEHADVLVPKWGTANCQQLDQGAFCQTPPLPPGEVTISGASSQKVPHMEWKFQVPAKGERVLVSFPKVMP